VANEIRIPIIGEDRASRPMREVGRSAEIAARGARILADSLEAQKRAASAAADADLKLAKANTIMAVTEHRLGAERARVTQDLQRRLDAAGGQHRVSRALVSAGALRQLFGGGGGGAGAAGAAASAAAGGAPAASGLLDFLGSPAGAGAAAAAAFPAASLISALLGQGLGTGVAGAAGGLAALFRPGVFTAGLNNIKRSLSTVTASFAPSLGLMFNQFGKTVQGLVPLLSQLFGRSLPFMQQFFTLLGTAAKTILPALTSALTQMVKSGALTAMTQGFVYLIQAVASLITHLGPGMKAGAEIFRAVADAIRGITYGLADVIAFLGKTTGHWLSRMHGDWDHFRHDVAVIFDGIRHDIAAAWNTIYADTLGVVRAGDRAIIGFFQKLPGQILRDLFGLGHSLGAFAAAALTEMWAGFKRIGSEIFGWIKGFAHGIVGILTDVWKVLSPSAVFYDIGKNLMLGLEKGIQAHAHRAVSAAGKAAGAVSGTAGAAQRYAQSILSAYGWGGQWAALNAVAMRESGWSLTARNPSSGAYGIAQFIGGPSEYYQYGGNPNTVSGQVIAFFNYIRQRYGNPGAAWAHELNFGWYDKGGWLPPGLSLAYNATGRPEQVLPRAASAGPLVIRMEFAAGSDQRLTAAMVESLRKHVRISGGDVQLALGRR
jgi:hypothetical protein